MKRKKKTRQVWTVRIIAILLLIVLVVTGAFSVSSCFRGEEYTDEAELSDWPYETEETESNEPEEVTILAVGDIIAHDTILHLAQTDDGYDFTSLFEILKEDISSVDLAIANLETVLGGDDDGRIYGGYPNFNTPDEMGDAIIDAGFNLITEATNHSMDSGTDAIRHAISYWDGKSDEATMVGLYSSQDDADKIHKVKVNGIKIAVLNYTYGLNGYVLPEDESYLVTLLNEDNEEYILAQIKQASLDTDFVIVCPHWGTEYELGTPDDTQIEWAKKFTEAGADLIIGTHPHVIENIEWITSDNGNEALCYYSLGNFISNQEYTDTVLGGMAYLKIVKDDDETYIDADSAGVIPVVTQNDKTGDPVVIQTYYLADYTDDLAAVHDTKLSYESDFSVEALNSIANEVFAGWIIDRVE